MTKIYIVFYRHGSNYDFADEIEAIFDTYEKAEEYVLSQNGTYRELLYIEDYEINKEV